MDHTCRNSPDRCGVSSGTRATAVILAALCVPLTAVAATVGGLFGPIGITIYSAVCSLPAWLTLGAVALYQNKVAKKRSQQSEI